MVCGARFHSHSPPLPQSDPSPGMIGRMDHTKGHQKMSDHFETTTEDGVVVDTHTHMGRGWKEQILCCVVKSMMWEKKGLGGGGFLSFTGLPPPPLLRLCLGGWHSPPLPPPPHWRLASPPGEGRGSETVDAASSCSDFCKSSPSCAVGAPRSVFSPSPLFGVRSPLAAGERDEGQNAELLTALAAAYRFPPSDSPTVSGLAGG